MTAINESGQVYFTFEELDVEGALQELNVRVNGLIRVLEVGDITYGSWFYNATQLKIDKYIKIILYLERLKRGQSYV